MMLFWERGYKDTSLSNIMQATKLNKQSIYDTFGDKHALFLSALRLYREEGLRRIAENVQKELKSRKKTVDILAKMITPPAVKEGVPKGCLIVNSSLEFQETDKEVFSEVKKMFRGYEEQLELVVQEGQNRGEITKKFSSDRIMKILSNTYKGLRIAERIGQSVDSMEEVTQSVLDMISI